MSDPKYIVDSDMNFTWVSDSNKPSPPVFGAKFKFSSGLVEYLTVWDTLVWLENINIKLKKLNT